MKNSKKTILAWCREVTGAPVSLLSLRVEASHRVFYRTSGHGDESWVAMSSPPELENNDQFLALDELFHANGLGVPKIMHKDLALGYFLMEDLADTHLEDLYPANDLAGTTGLSDTPLAQEAVIAALDTLQQLQPLRSELIPPYDQTRMTMEFDLFDEWFLTKLLGCKVTAEQQDLLTSVKHTLITAMLDQPQACVHRDYHCRNLLYRSRAPAKSIGIVDFQDALYGPALYDPASLLRDCYYTFSEQDIDTLLKHYLNASSIFSDSDYDLATIKTWFDLTAMQRQMKAVGIFARLHLRDGKSSHLEHIPSVLNRIVDLAASHNDTYALADFLKTLDQPMADCRHLA